jgi:hypothetical protein
MRQLEINARLYLPSDDTIQNIIDKGPEGFPDIDNSNSVAAGIILNYSFEGGKLTPKTGYDVCGILRLDPKNPLGQVLVLEEPGANPETFNPDVALAYSHNNELAVLPVPPEIIRRVLEQAVEPSGLYVFGSKIVKLS